MPNNIYIRILLTLTVAWLSCFDLLWDLYCQSRTSPKNKLISFFKLSKNKKNFDFENYICRMSPSDVPSFVHLVQWFRDTSDEVRLAWSNSFQTRKTFQDRFHAAYNFVPHADLFLTAMGTLSVAWFLRRSLHRYKNANDLPLSFFEGRQKRLKGLAISVNDSDNIRFYHQPHFYSLFKPNLARQDLKYHTINIRLAGIDAPEVKKFNLLVLFLDLILFLFLDGTFRYKITTLRSRSQGMAHKFRSRTKSLHPITQNRSIRKGSSYRVGSSKEIPLDMASLVECVT